jgi:dTDP-glucose 4,6-dehydratase
VVNVGSGFEISIGDLAHLIADVMGVTIQIETEEDRLRPEKSEVDRLHACNRRLRDWTDWVPEYASIDGLRKGLKETAAWFSTPDNLRQYKIHHYNV